MCYENMINFIAVLRLVAFCRYVFLCLSFLVDELGPPVVKDGLLNWLYIACGVMYNTVFLSCPDNLFP